MKAFYRLNTIFLFFILTACGLKNNHYWDISKFTITDSSLSPREELKILYYSGGKMEYENEIKAYIQLIAVSQVSGDTINILSKPPFKNYTKEQFQELQYYYSENTIEYKKFGYPEYIFKDIDLDFNTLRDSKREKVYRDSRFDNMADNHYPTTIGCILPYR